MKVYLAGPMRGLPLFNFPAFEAATERLRTAGHEVFSPHEHGNDGFDVETGAGIKTLREYMQTDLPAVLASEAVVVLPGWERSQGAKLEVHVATECAISVFTVDELLSATERAEASGG